MQRKIQLQSVADLIKNYKKSPYENMRNYTYQSIKKNLAKYSA